LAPAPSDPFVGGWPGRRIPGSMRFRISEEAQMAEPVTLEIFTDYV
jgi:hypothetical protein